MTKNWFSTDYPLMQVKSIAECSKGSILQFFWPSLTYHLSLRSLCCLFLSGRWSMFYCICLFPVSKNVLQPCKICTIYPAIQIFMFSSCLCKYFMSINYPYLCRLHVFTLLNYKQGPSNRFITPSNFLHNFYGFLFVCLYAARRKLGGEYSEIFEKMWKITLSGNND